MRRVVLVLAGLFCIGAMRPHSEAQDEDPRPLRNGPAHPGVSAQEMNALRPLAMAHLRRLFSEGGERPDVHYLREEFRRCKFRHLILGKLGTAVMMTCQDPGGGPNGGSYEIYLRRNGTYRRIAEGGGFGPYVLEADNGVPDLAFGTTTGVCTENFLRLRYSGTRYKPDACIQNVRDGSSDGCHIEVCDDPRHLPTFPEPDPAAMQ